MKPRRYEPADADALAPLLRSIGRELEERAKRLAEIEERMSDLRSSPFHGDEMRALAAELATHRREVRHCHGELESLGCSVVGTAPLTIRIPTRVGDAKGSRMWQPRRRARS